MVVEPARAAASACSSTRRCRRGLRWRRRRSTVAAYLLFSAAALAAAAANTTTTAAGARLILDSGDDDAGATPEDLLYLFDRPFEPVYTPRGLWREALFDIPKHWLPERVWPQLEEARGLALRLVPVADLPMPTEAFADVDAVLPKRGVYSRIRPPWAKINLRLQHFFRESRTLSELLSRGVWARLHMNPEMVLDSLRLSINRLGEDGALPVLARLNLPSFMQTIPTQFVDDELIAKAREEMFTMPPGTREAIPVERNFSRLAYFEEDAGLSEFHFIWHYSNPATFEDKEYIDRHRRGETFVFFHRQLLARYKAERFANGLPAALPLDMSQPLPGEYFPRMLHLHQSRGYADRHSNTSVKRSLVNEHLSWIKRYRTAIADGFFVMRNGTRLRLADTNGADVIGNVLEGNSLLSPNYDYYGNLHNHMHRSIGGSHDRNTFKSETLGCEESVLLSVRDSIFYNIHALVDNLFEEYLRTLPPYTREELRLPGVEVRSVAVQAEAVGDEDEVPANELRTFWQQSDVDVARGLDFTPPGSLFARFTHLQHRPFNYSISVENHHPTIRRVTVRLFLLLQDDEKGLPLDMQARQRGSIFMDTFSAPVRPGSNLVRRSSLATPLTVDMDAWLSSSDARADAYGRRQRSKCRCGWRQHLLVPRGTVQGMRATLLAMATPSEDLTELPAEAGCSGGWPVCGLRRLGGLYPDSRPMGFPFDRPVRPGVRSLPDFVTDNMAAQDVRIVHEDRVEPPSRLLPGGSSTSWMPAATALLEC